jgi:hypothetical protein
MTPKQRALLAGGVAGVAVAAFRLRGDVAFDVGVLIGGALGGMALAYLISLAVGWLR